MLWAVVLLCLSAASVQAACTTKELDAAAACYGRHAKMMMNSNPCLSMQAMVSCYISRGCTDKVKPMCQQARTKGCWQLNCEDPKIEFEVSKPARGSNSIFIKNATQFVMLDTGMTEEDAKISIKIIKRLIGEGKKFRAVMITHPHPDHVMSAWKINEEYPTTPIYLGTNAAKQELIHGLYEFGPFLDPASPGNPVGKATKKFDYQKNIQVLWSSYDLWGSPDVNVMKDMYQMGETRHFSIISIPAANAMITGDLVEYKMHLWLNGVDLQMQCGWLEVLNKLKYMADDETRLFPGHGMSGDALRKEMTAPKVIQSSIDYLNYARTATPSNCDPNIVKADLRKKFVEREADAKNGKLDRTIGSLPPSPTARVPADAKYLGCDCGKDPKKPVGACTKPPPKCIVPSM
eukprot:TRINITY_DN46857_c0_g1_i1.p1 TRINITY_DN46857_c0_g1~~TRINITY_DN46857_c0_g1_i1.p1  ORF type:complete len:405 (+),score=40.13 TRINITY_DN46857_c0_g1_i1:26-1240(+)